MEARLRVVEIDQTAMLTRLNSLVDHDGNDGIITQMSTRLENKIDKYAATVQRFIEGEPDRGANITRGWQAALTEFRKMHESDKELAEKKRKREKKYIDRKHVETSARLDRHEQLVQRGQGLKWAWIGLSAMVVFVGGLLTVGMTIVGILWWVFVHVPVK